MFADLETYGNANDLVNDDNNGEECKHNINTNKRVTDSATQDHIENKINCGFGKIGFGNLKTEKIQWS